MMPQRASRRRILSMRASMVVSPSCRSQRPSWRESRGRGSGSLARRSPSRIVDCSFVRGLAGGEVGLYAGAVACEVAADEDGLGLRAGGIELQPRELVAAAREVEDAVPVAVGEADDALRAENVGGEAAQHALERFLAERSTRAPDEASDAVHAKMVGRRAGALAVRRDAGREEDVAVDGAANRTEALRPRVELRDAPLGPRERPVVDQIDL